MATARSSRPAGRRRHRHRRRHLARRRQGRQLGRRSPPAAPASTAITPLPDRPSEHPHRRHGRFPAVELTRRQPLTYELARPPRRRRSPKSGSAARRFRRAAVPRLAAGRARLARALSRSSTPTTRDAATATTAARGGARGRTTATTFETRSCSARSPSWLADRFGTRGPPITLSTACASGATAIQLGVEAIRRGECDRGALDRRRRLGNRRGADPLLAAVGAVDPQRHPGEGVQAILQEPRRLRAGRRRRRRWCWKLRRRARARGADDPRHPPRLRREGRRFPSHPLQAGRLAGHRRGSRRTFADAGLRQDEIDYVNAHGTSTPENDKMERSSLRPCSASACAAIPISRTSR